MTKYLLSTGKSTTQVEKYILDLFKLNLKIWPGDIPGLPKVGFDFILTDTKKDEVVDEVRYRVRTLVDRLKERFSDQKIDIEVYLCLFFCLVDCKPLYHLLRAIPCTT
jgi:hypothetical protein